MPKGISMKYGLFFVLCLHFVGSNGQANFDFCRYSHRRIPDSTFAQSPTATDIVEWNLELNLPLVLSDKTTMITGIFGSSTQLLLDPLLADASKQYAMGLTLGLNHRYDEGWNATYMLVPKGVPIYSIASTRGHSWGFRPWSKKPSRSDRNIRWAFL